MLKTEYDGAYGKKMVKVTVKNIDLGKVKLQAWKGTHINTFQNVQESSVGKICLFLNATQIWPEVERSNIRNRYRR